jgi:peptidoglycan hydrolase-like protein with peptidoglycan-binding domain
MALGGGAAVAGNGGTTPSQGDENASASSVTLKPGSRGTNVKRLQRKLRVTVSGYYGPLTKKAVKRFQRRKGLKPDGVAGPDTLAKLRLRVTAEPEQTDDGGGSDVEVPAKLQRIAQCESGGNPRAVSPGGTYRGKYQFSRATWRNLGGTGDPAAAPEWLQDRLALKLYRQSGTAPWPSCA